MQKKITHMNLNYRIAFVVFCLPSFHNSVCPLGKTGEKENCTLNCGLSYSKPNILNNKIVGGVAVQPGSWPSYAYVVFNYKANVFLDDIKQFVTITHSTFCGGSLIDVKTIMTAAHCVIKKKIFLNFCITLNYFHSRNKRYRLILISLKILKHIRTEFEITHFFHHMDQCSPFT